MTTAATVAAADTADLSVSFAPAEMVVLDPRVGTPSEPVAGSWVYVFPRVANLGTATARNVQLEFKLPETASLQLPQGDDTCSFDDSTLRCAIGDLAPGSEGWEARYVVKIAYEVLGKVTLSAIANSATTEANPADNTGSQVFDIDEIADVSGTPVMYNGDDGTPDDAVAGGTVELYLKNTNHGPSDSYYARSHLAWDTDLTLRDIGYRCTMEPDGRSASCGGGSDGSAFPVDSTWNGIGVKLAIDPDWTGPITVTGNLTPGSYDPNPSNNAGTYTFTPRTSADLSLTNVANVAAVRRGQSVTWTLTTRNAGPSTARKVVVTDQVPAGMSITALPNGCRAVRQTVTCTLPNLRPSESASVAISAKATKQPRAATNTARVTSSTPDPATTNNSSSTVTRASTPRTPR